MALGRLSQVSVQSRSARRVQGAPSRYAQCQLVVEGGCQRLSFRRYAEFDQNSTGATQTGVLAPGSEHRLDSISRTVYGDSRYFWAVALFNRWVALNPLRYVSGVKLAFPPLVYLVTKINAAVSRLC